MVILALLSFLALFVHKIPAAAMRNGSSSKEICIKRLQIFLNGNGNENEESQVEKGL
jgi:hypothetical protein